MNTAQKTNKARIRKYDNNYITVQNMLKGKVYDYKTGSWVDHKMILTDGDKDQLFNLLSKRMREKNKGKLKSNLNYLESIKSYTRLDRICIEPTNGQWSYNANQCYTTEIAEIRKKVIDL